MIKLQIIKLQLKGLIVIKIRFFDFINIFQRHKIKISNNVFHDLVAPSSSLICCPLYTQGQQLEYNSTQQEGVMMFIILVDLNGAIYKQRQQNYNKRYSTSQVFSSLSILPEATVVAEQQSDLKSTISQWVDSTKSFFNFQDSCSICDRQEVQEILRVRRQFVRFFCHPLGDIYRQAPLALSDWKFKLIERYDQRQRLFSLQALTLGMAVLTLKFKPNVGLSQRFLFSIRNSAITFLLGGLLIAPQIYNPFIKSDF